METFMDLKEFWGTHGPVGGACPPNLLGKQKEVNTLPALHPSPSTLQETT